MGWGSSTRRGGGRKVRALPRKFVFLGFRREECGMSREFCRDVPDPCGCSRTLCKKSSCAFFVPYPLPSPGPLRMPKNSSKETELGTTQGAHLGEEDCRGTVPGAPPFPIHKAPRMPKDSSKKTNPVQGQKARLRNPESRQPGGGPPHSELY